MTQHLAPAPETRARDADATLQDSPGLLRALAAGAVLLVFAGLFAVCHALDGREDRDRPMYRDVLTMEWIQYDRLRRGMVVVPVELHAGDRLAPDDAGQVVSPGVRVRVVARGGGYCVRGSNQFGESTRWDCGDGSVRPAPLGALAQLG